MMMSGEDRLATTLRLDLPSWCAELASRSRGFDDDLQKMGFVIELSRRNVAERSGGPFAAAVFEIGENRLISVGLNVVVPSHSSVAHAEILALALAQQRLRSFDLGGHGARRFELVTSAQPCVQCFGAIWWSGIGRLVVGARREEVESITGFREGPLVDDWIDRLENRRDLLRGVEVVLDVMRDEACQVLRDYVEGGGTVYNPS
jgi:tRNA(Arg) A34 adenosine deaminase TadA